MANAGDSPVSKYISIPGQKKDIEACITQLGGDEPSHAIVLTHGAGGDMDNKQLVQLSLGLACAGFMCVRFTCKGLNLQYRNNVYTTVVRYLRTHYPDLSGCFVGGRSMGSRAAVGVLNGSRDTDLRDFLLGAVCVSYPLHRPHDPDNLRDQPLYELDRPALFVSGTEDDMCTRSLFDNVREQIKGANSDMFWIDGGNHGLAVKGRKEGEVTESVCKHVTQWCQQVIVLNNSSRGDNSKTASQSKEQIASGNTVSSINKRRKSSLKGKKVLLDEEGKKDLNVEEMSISNAKGRKRSVEKELEGTVTRKRQARGSFKE